MASVQNSTDPGPTRHSKALVQNSTDPALTRQTMASVQNSTDPGPTRQSKALVHNCSDPVLTRQTMASVQNSTDPGPIRQSMASAHNRSDPAPTCQHTESVQISSDPAPECQKMALKHGSLSPGRDECIFVGYSTQSRAYIVFNKRTRVIMESIHVNFDELPQMASAHNSSDPAPTCQTMASTMALEHNSLSPGRKCQENVSHRDKTVTTSNELDVLFSLMFDELLNGSSKVVSKSSAVSTADAPNERQQLTTPLINHTTHAPTCQTPSITPTVISSENINQAEPHAENDQVADDEFINIFSTPVQDQGETSLRHVDSSNMHTFYQRYPSEHHWIKDHPLEQVIGNPSQSVRTRRQLESDAEMCMFALTVSQTEPKNIKEAMADSYNLLQSL
nr:Gag-Pol polyprotein [Tanacetum cinerariifolium]